jgi:hypothetical protein
VDESAAPVSVELLLASLNVENPQDARPAFFFANLTISSMKRTRRNFNIRGRKIPNPAL